MAKHVLQGHCPDSVEPDDRDPECPACIEMGGADRAREADAHHIRNLERLVRLKDAEIAEADKRAATHCLQVVRLYGRLALAENGSARMRAAAEVTEAREILTAAQRTGDDWDEAYCAWVAAGRRYDDARRAEAAERSGA